MVISESGATVWPLAVVPVTPSLAAMVVPTGASVTATLFSRAMTSAPPVAPARDTVAPSLATTTVMGSSAVMDTLSASTSTIPVPSTFWAPSSTAYVTMAWFSRAITLARLMSLKGSTEPSPMPEIKPRLARALM